jgi:uncharacterized protein YqhQ
LNNIKIGGQAFGDGVLMRSKRYWALVREDGSIEFGATSSWLDHHPKWNIFLVRSIITFLETAKFGLKTYEKSSGMIGTRFVIWMAIYVAITLPASMLFRHWLGESVFVNAFSQFFYLAMALLAITKGTTGKIWMYHGAEHKTVNAYENGCDLNDITAVQSYSRVHQRCGTNIMFLMLMAAVLYIPNPNVGINMLICGLYMVLTMAMSLELFRQLMRRPQHIITKIFLLGGNTLQRFATTKEPSDGQVVIASKALQLVLALEIKK